MIGVVLSGVLDDGAAGLLAVKSRGGLAVVQDPEDAAYAGMPESALRTVPADYVLPASTIGAQLGKVVREPVDTIAMPDPTPLLRYEHAVAQNLQVPNLDLIRIGRFAGLTCPDCHGALVALEPGEDRFRCRVGRAWSADALLVAADDLMQNALWMAVRTLDEKAELALRMADSARARGSERLAIRYKRTAEESSQAAVVLRDRLTAAGAQPARED